MLRRLFHDGGFRRAAWLAADAAVAAALAGPAEVLLLFVLSPDRPLTLGDALATLLAILPQVLVIFVLLGPALVLVGLALSVGRSTRCGFSVRYVLRFALIDVVLLTIAVTRQWTVVGPLLPGRGQTALALMTTALVVAGIVLLALAIRDFLRPSRVGGPWLAAVAIALFIALGCAAEIRRVHHEPPESIALPGISMARPFLLLEMPALGPEDFRSYAERGIVPVFSALRRSGVSVPLQGVGLSDAISLHSTLLSGQPVERHGVFGAVRYQPLGDRRSFAVLPRGLFLRPLLRTPLWSRIRVDYRALRCTALPGIASSIGTPLAMISDPLGWPSPTPDSWMIPESVLIPGARLAVPGQDAPLICGDPGDAASLFFDPIAEDLPESEYLGLHLREALARDLCALEAARLAAASGRYGIVHVRLAGYYDTAYQFAGWRRTKRARAASEVEVSAWGRTLTRYAARIAPGLERLVAATDEQGLVVLVSAHGIRSRSDLGRLGEALTGEIGHTGTHAGPPPGVALFSSPQTAKNLVLDGAAGLDSLLPTSLWLAGLPVGEDMGRVDRRVLGEGFLDQSPLSLPSYALPPSSGRVRSGMLGSEYGTNTPRDPSEAAWR